MNKPLIIFEMANNHMGDLDHGLNVVSTFGAVCRQFPEFKFAFKLQYRDLETFIHPSMKGRDDIKYIKRFSETQLNRRDFDKLVERIREEGFLAMATPFDILIVLPNKLNQTFCNRIFMACSQVSAGATVWNIPRLVSIISRIMNLRPGSCMLV